MNWSLIRTIILIPGTVMVFIPAIIIVLTENTKYSAKLLPAESYLFWMGLIIAGIGLFLATWTVKLFVKIGKGTPAPWNPPQNLVVIGPYRHVRNPMLLSAFLIVLAEAVILQSFPIAIWLAFIIIANFIYIHFFEEKTLEERYGEEYRQYKRHVPAWIPRLTPWR